MSDSKATINNIPISKLFKYTSGLPKLYAASTAPFWDDEHISKHMLEAHLNPNHDAASRKPDFMQKSADWIAMYCNANGKKLLDLGCGAGIYTELFHERGFCVTGVDFSKRSIGYARRNAEERGYAITYLYMDYLNISFDAEFDVATLIYCDFGVLSPESRAVLLQKVYTALKVGGILILDAWNVPYLDSYSTGDSVRYEKSGFWSDDPSVVIERDRYYEATANTLEQYIVVTESGCECYNTWNQIYNSQTLTAELESAGFEVALLCDDVCGTGFTGQLQTLCAVAVKPE